MAWIFDWGISKIFVARLLCGWLMLFSLTTLRRGGSVFLTSVRALSASSTPRKNQLQKQKKIAIIGGGASGIFASIHAASDPATHVIVFEAGRHTLTKVKISGGGRCNVLHDTRKPTTQLLEGYPRGQKELRGILTKRFSATAARTWFEDRGVHLKTEADGRMFPQSDSSQTIMDCLLDAAHEYGVDIWTSTKVHDIVQQKRESNDTVHGGGFDVIYTTRNDSEPDTERFDAVILATGSARAGYGLIRNLNIPFVSTVPSLFTLSTKHAVVEGGLLHGLAGVSVQCGEVAFALPKKPGKKQKWLSQQGPILITHQGLSGPAPLRLSAFGAVEMAEQKYQGRLRVHWAPELGSQADLEQELWDKTRASLKKVTTVCPIEAADISKRLWSALVLQAGISDDEKWPHMSKAKTRKLAEQIASTTLELTGKSTFKEEFVTAGGVDLKSIDMRSMQSKSINGLFFCGEVINIDGITGGYNFLNCWR